MSPRRRTIEHADRAVSAPGTEPTDETSPSLAPAAASAPIAPLEVELKYAILDPAAGERLLAARSIGGLRGRGPVRPTPVVDRYVDTVGGVLGRAGWATRIRETPAGRLVTLKATTVVDGALHRRTELEGPAGDGLDPRTWPESDVRAAILAGIGDEPLAERGVEVRQLRRYRTLASHGSEVELTVDEVEVHGGGRILDRFATLEAELKKGPEAALDALAAELAGEPGLTPDTRSKMERALGALAAAGLVPGAPREPSPGALRELGPRPAETASAAGPAIATGPAIAAEPEVPPIARLVVGRSPGVTHDDVLAEAGRKVLRFHLARMLVREPGTRTGRDAEDLHGMRVATRRMRAAWRVFGDGFRPARTRRLRARLRILAGRLGAVRDLDVLIAAAVAHQAALPEDEAAAFEPLVAAWREQRDVARILLVRELDSEDYRRLVDEYRVFVATEGAAAVPPASPTTPHRVRDTAGSRIWTAYEQVRAYEAVLRWSDVETLHQLRIAAKWLRYTIEFFREALGPEAEVLIPRVVALQDHLGWLHDADVTAQLARAFLVAESGRLSRPETEAIGNYLRLKERDLERLRRTVGAPWRSVSGATFRRLLGRAVAGL